MPIPDEVIILGSGELICKKIETVDDLTELSVLEVPKSYLEESPQKERIEWLISQDMAHPIIDIGCSIGYIINKVGGEVGVDIRAGKLLLAKREYPGINFYYGNIFNLSPFYNAGFKTIIASEIFEHLPYEYVHSAIIHCLRVAPTLIFTVPVGPTADNTDHKWWPDEEKVTKLFNLVHNHNIEFTISTDHVTEFLCGRVELINEGGSGMGGPI